MAPDTATCVTCGRDLPIGGDSPDEVQLVADPFLSQVAGEEEIDWWCGECLTHRALSI